MAKQYKSEQVTFKKPVNPKWFAGFFMLLGIIVLLLALYDSGRLKVPIGTTHDQMGNAIEKTGTQSCKSDVKLMITEHSPARQRQVYALIDLFPDVSSSQSIKVILCNGSEVFIDHRNYSKYTVLSKRHKTYHLIKQKNNNKKKNKALQIKHINKIN